MFLPSYAQLLVKIALQVRNAGDVAKWLPGRPYEAVDVGEGEREGCAGGEEEGVLEGDVDVDVEVDMAG